MTAAWGVDAQNIIRRFWRDTDAADGDTVEGWTVKLSTLGVPPKAEDVGRVLSSDGFPMAPTISGAEAANRAFRAMEAQFLEWERGLIAFGPDVYRVGSAYLAAAYQAAKLVLADTTTYSHALAATIFRNAALGADGITSPPEFANSAYAARGAAAPTRALLWTDKTTGARLALNSMADFGALVSERPFLPPTSYRS